MTYKSFRTILQEQDDAGRLVCLPVLFDPDQSDIRELWMPPALLRNLSQRDPKKTMEYNANIRAFLSRFVHGEEIDNCTYMKCWSPKHIFELRVQLQNRKDATRIFGAFGELNCFVAFYQRPRSFFGGKDDPRWAKEIQRTIDAWDEIFPPHFRMQSRPFSNCVTGGIEVPREECL